METPSIFHLKKINGGDWCFVNEIFVKFFFVEKVPLIMNSNRSSIDNVVYTTLTPPNRCTKRLLNAGDTLLSLLVISPLVVTHWRGTWVFMDHHSEHFPGWNCFIFGGILHTTFALLREPLNAEFATSSNGNKSTARTIKRCIVSKLYTYIFSLGCNMHWRGGWAVMELHLGKVIFSVFFIQSKNPI